MGGAYAEGGGVTNDVGEGCDILFRGDGDTGRDNSFVYLCFVLFVKANIYEYIYLS